MLSYYSAQVVAYIADGGFYHPHCAREVFSTISVEKADAGLSTAHDLTPISRFSLDEYRYEDAWEYAQQDTDDDPDEDEVEAIAEGWVTCDHCRLPIN